MLCCKSNGQTVMSNGDPLKLFMSNPATSRKNRAGLWDHGDDSDLQRLRDTTIATCLYNICLLGPLAEVS